MFRKQKNLVNFESQKSNRFLRNHYCEFEVYNELILCPICGNSIEGEAI